MTKQVHWNKQVFQKFIDEAMLNDLQIEIMKRRIKGDTRSKTCRELHLSMSTHDREIAKLKRMYDEVQKQFPDELPVRRVSKQEIFMDNN